MREGYWDTCPDTYYVCGPFDVQTKDGYLYFIIFIDDYSWYGYVYLMRYKSKVFEKFKKFRYEVKK